MSEGKGSAFLKKSITDKVNNLQKKILDLAEVSVHPANWKALRSKILDATNEARRLIITDIETNYEVSHTPVNSCEHVVEVVSSKKQGLVNRSWKKGVSSHE